MYARKTTRAFRRVAETSESSNESALSESDFGDSANQPGTSQRTKGKEILTREGKARKRAPRFTVIEEETLAQEYAKRSKILLEGRGDPQYIKKYNKAWEEIAAEVRKVSQYSRTLDQLRRRVRTARSTAKHNEAERHKDRMRTGGGSASFPPATFAENLYSQTIQPEMVRGIVPEG